VTRCDESRICQHHHKGLHRIVFQPFLSSKDANAVDMGYIPAQGLQNLKKYTYKGVDKSFLSNHVLNPYWNWLVGFWPKWVAPNVITLSGFTLVFINFLTLIYYDSEYLTEKDGAGSLPRWIYFTWAAGLFLYQSFDAIDG